MIALTLATALLAGSQLASAIAVPTYPDSTAVVKIGDELTTLWTADTTGEWTDMTIQLMTGSNLAMVALTTVGTNIDATTSTNYTFTIPDVTPTSAIYFLQYTATNMNASDTQWTTRWTIAGTDGSTTTPEYSTQPSGDAIAWGLGALVNGTTSTTSNSTTSTTSNSTTSTTSNSTTSTSSSDVLATSSASASAAASTASKSASSMVSVAASSTASAASSATKSSAAASSATSSISGASERVVGASLGAVLVGALVALVM